MNDKIIKEMEQAGIDVDGAVRRFSGNEPMYIKFLLRFCDDDNFNQVGKAVEADDVDTMLSAAHTLKGVAGNLGMNRMFDVCSDMVNKIRGGNPEAAKAVYPALEESYDQVRGVLAKLAEESR